MLRHIRWQLALAVAGVVLVGAALFYVSNRAFVDRPARGGSMVEAIVGRPATLNPLLATSEVERDVARLIYAGLTRPGDNGRILPDLASAWEVSEDGRSYTFRLRSGATWHDGTPVSAEDAILTARLARDEDLATERNPLAAAWELVESVESPEEGVLRITLSEPYAPFLDATTLGLLPAHIFADVPPSEIHRHPASTTTPVGAGPWRIELPGGLGQDELRLVRFEEHWEATGGRPYLDGLSLRTYSTTAAALEALGQREVDILSGVPPGAISLLGDDISEYNSTQDDHSLVFLNPAKRIFADERVRRALSLAIDRQGIIEDPALLDGQGVIGASPISPGSWAHADDLPAPAFDIEAAEALLEEAGWRDTDGDGVLDSDGRPLRFALDTFNEPLLVAIAERLAEDWARIGVEVELRPQSQQNMVRALTDRAYDAALYDLVTLGQYTPDPYPLWHSSQADDGQNYGGWRDPEADEVLVALRQTSPEDLETRLALYRRFQELFAEQQPALVLYYPVRTAVRVNPGLGGVQMPRLLVDGADRFLTLGDWFVNTERILLGDGDEDS